jgi:7-dehydrocholesterol reductase
MYTLQGQYLARNPVDLSPLAFSAVLLSGLGGYWIFRAVNHQKNLVRQTKGDCTIWGSPAQFIKARYTTSDGEEHESILLCSGKDSVYVLILL